MNSNKIETLSLVMRSKKPGGCLKNNVLSEGKDGSAGFF